MRFNMYVQNCKQNWKAITEIVEIKKDINSTLSNTSSFHKFTMDIQPSKTIKHILLFKKVLVSRRYKNSVVF